MQLSDTLTSLFSFQLKAAQLEWNYNWKKLSENNSVPPPISEERDVPSRSPRHQRLLKKHITELEKTTKTYRRASEELRSRILKLEEEMRILQRRQPELERIAGNEIDDYLKLHKLSEIVGEDNSIPSSFEERLSKLEVDRKIGSDSIFNLSRQLTNFDKLHMSMLELLENVESIENKVDKNFPEFRKEISKLEVQTSEAASEIALLKEDQGNTRKSVKAIGVSASNIKDKLDFDHSQLVDLCDAVDNLKKSSTVQTSKLHDHILKVRTAVFNFRNRLGKSN